MTGPKTHAPEAPGEGFPKAPLMSLAAHPDPMRLQIAREILGMDQIGTAADFDSAWDEVWAKMKRLAEVERRSQVGTQKLGDSATPKTKEESGNALTALASVVEAPGPVGISVPQQKELTTFLESFIARVTPPEAAATVKRDLALSIDRVANLAIGEAIENHTKDAVRAILTRLHEVEPALVGVRFIRTLWDNDDGTVVNSTPELEYGFKVDPTLGVRWNDNDEYRWKSDAIFKRDHKPDPKTNLRWITPDQIDDEEFSDDLVGALELVEGEIQEVGEQLTDFRGEDVPVTLQP